MIRTLICRMYQRRIHHVLTMLRLIRPLVSCYVPCLTTHSITPYGFHAYTTIISCAPVIILVVA
ncbi:hypothetical protein Hanom_Chr07g00633751 [Helianthus anomalus]